MLRDALLAALPPDDGARLAAEPGLGAALDELVARGQAAWPALPLPPERFVAYAAARLHPVELAGIGALSAEDLWLACACAVPLPGALEAFERAHLVVLQGVLERLGAPPEVTAEAQQTMRKALFVREPDRAPEIEDYRGRGPLRGWLRVMAVRLTTRLLQKRRKDVDLGDGALLDALCPGEDPGVAFVKNVHRADLSKALGEALQTLTPKERNLLRQHLLDGLSSEQIGALYRVHRTTVFRWIEKIRAHVLKQTRQALMKRLQIDRSDADSLMHMVQSQVDVSLERLLSPR